MLTITSWSNRAPRSPQLGASSLARFALVPLSTAAIIAANVAHSPRLRRFLPPALGGGDSGAHTMRRLLLMREFNFDDTIMSTPDWLWEQKAREAMYDAMVAERYENAKSLHAASYFGIDDVIDPADFRRWIMAGLRSVPSPPPRTGKKRPYVDTW